MRKLWIPESLGGGPKTIPDFVDENDAHELGDRVADGLGYENNGSDDWRKTAITARAMMWRAW